MQCTTPCPFCAGTRTEHVYTRVFQGRTWHLARCRDCGLHFTDPIPSDADIAGFYSGSYHEQLLQPGAAEREFGAKFRRYVRWIGEFVPSGRTLDIGCSTGLLPALLMQGGYQAEGLELNSSVAEWGISHYGVSIRTAPFDGTYEEDAYDLISLTDVLEHTRHPLEFLKLVRRKPETPRPCPRNLPRHSIR